MIQGVNTALLFVLGRFALRLGIFVAAFITLSAFIAVTTTSGCCGGGWHRGCSAFLCGSSLPFRVPTTWGCGYYFNWTTTGGCVILFQ